MASYFNTQTLSHIPNRRIPENPRAAGTNTAVHRAQPAQRLKAQPVNCQRNDNDGYFHLSCSSWVCISTHLEDTPSSKMRSVESCRYCGRIGCSGDTGESVSCCQLCTLSVRRFLLRGVLALRRGRRVRFRVGRIYRRKAVEFRLRKKGRFPLSRARKSFLAMVLGTLRGKPAQR